MKKKSYLETHDARATEDPDENDRPTKEAQEFRGIIRYENQLSVRCISYYLNSEIIDSHHYTDLFNTLRNANSTDEIYIHLNSPGGDFNTGLQIINNILASSAHVVTILEARAYSMAAMIFLCGDELIVHDNCQLMFHIYSGIFAGKGSEQQAEITAVSTWFEKIMRRLTMPFLTDAEIKNIQKGVDVWMDSDEIRNRLNSLKKTRRKPRTKKIMK
jgi:ATP-dependent Clp protease protease subunit